MTNLKDYMITPVITAQLIRSFFFFIGLFFIGSFTVSVSQANMLFGDPENGKKLHDEKCLACHVKLQDGFAEKIYQRSNRHVNTIEGLNGQVRFCDKQLKTKLNTDEVDDLIIYLNKNFYHFEQE